jgi:hypothetical protein
MSKHAAASAETVERLTREIRAKRQQVHDALEVSLQAGRDLPAGESRLHQVFASFHGVDATSGSDR